MSAVFDELQYSNEIVFMGDEEQTLHYLTDKAANYYIL